MQPFADIATIVDDEEIETYEKFQNLPKKIPRLSTLDYHSYLLKHPDQIVKQSKWT